ncbi:MAG: hypothetical protein AAF849_15365 [Bacteroidota bacterium]
MEHKAVKSQVKKHIAKGETEEALDVLLEYSEEIDDPTHDEIVLLSGQFAQWKREKMLGIHQTSSELRRIELAIMEIVDKRLGKKPKQQRVRTAATPQAQSTPPPNPRVQQPTDISTTSPSAAPKKNTTPIVIGVLGVLLIGVLAVWLMNQNGTDSPAATTQSNQEIVRTKNADSTSVAQLKPADQQGQINLEETSTTPPPDNKTPVKSTTTTATPPAAGTANKTNKATTKTYRNTLRSGQSLSKGEEMRSSSGDFRLALQKDGNLMFTNRQMQFLWAKGRGKNATKLTLRDGNLVLLDVSGNVAWESGTSSAAKLTVKNSGELLLTDSSGSKVWSSKD